MERGGTWMKAPSQPSAASSLASADSTSALSAPDGERFGRLKSIPSNGLCLLTDFPLPDSLKMSVESERESSRAWIASQLASPAPTSAAWATAEKGASPDCAEPAADCSQKSSASPGSYSPLGWFSKTCRRCSLSMIAQTLSTSSAALPSAGMWEPGGCLMLDISESPRRAAAFTWSQVLDATPHWSSWLMPHQWSNYLSRVLRSRSHGLRTLSLGILLRQATHRPGSTWGVKFSWLKRTDGVRWLSGTESLAYMGFPSDWMLSIGRLVTRLGTPFVRKSLNGSHGSSRVEGSGK